MYGIEHFFLKWLKTQRGRLGLASLLTLTGMAWIWLLIPGAIGSWRLAGSSATVLADVIDSRVTHGPHLDTTYDLRYRFRLPGTKHWFYQSDHTGRSELWSSLPEREWSNVIYAGKIAVIYLPADPSVNDMQRNSGSPRKFAIIMVIMSVTWCLSGVLWLAVILGKRLAW